MADSSLFKREKNRTGGWGLKDVPRAIGEIFLLNIPYVSINKEGSRLACEQAHVGAQARIEAQARGVAASAKSSGEAARLLPGGSLCSSSLARVTLR